ncbi:Putative aminotransferase [Mycobacteroides abscessus]|nr:Putative aminotransferase [Mycobacteroides abscessus]
MLPADAGYVTYYANSLEEALSGAIRLVRHTSKVEAGHDPESWILVVDRDERLRRYFDPLSEGEYGALTQHVTFAVSAAEALTMLPTRAWSGLVILDPGEDSTEVLSAAQRHNTLRVIAESRAFGAIDAGRRLPAGDIFVFGENLPTSRCRSDPIRYRSRPTGYGTTHWMPWPRPRHSRPTRPL